MNEVVQVYRDFAGKWRWRVISGNNRITASSGESFRTRWNAKRAGHKQFPSLPLEVKSDVSIPGSED